MTQFVALIRGIGPGNPNMSNTKLKEVFEYLGFTNVQPVLSSGNVVFEYWMKSKPSTEWHIERVLKEKLDLDNKVIVRTKKDIQKIIESRPFKQHEDAPTSRFNVTFLKKAIKSKAIDPTLQRSGYTIVSQTSSEIFCIVDQTAKKTPTLMLDLEKAFGKDMTTRTWQTVLKVYARFH